jgi:hypothetical protein
MLFVCAPTQLRLYAAETGIMILVHRWCYKLKTTPEVKPPHLLELKNAQITLIRIHLFDSYDHTGINSDCSSDALAFIATPQPQGDGC